jgi:FkbM family methyltransferase
MFYSQNEEETIAIDYFNHREGASQLKTLLDIGANDGVTFSNSKFLIENGWVGFLLEPSLIAYQKCVQNHKNNAENTFIYNFGIANETGEQDFLESASHLPNGKDIALLSSVPSKLTERWRNAVDFKESKAMFYTFADFEKYFLMEGEKFPYVSIDAEGYDWEILKQIDLKKYEVEMLCIEWNGDTELERNYTEYCNRFGLRELHRNEENMIFAL